MASFLAVSALPVGWATGVVAKVAGPSFAVVRQSMNTAGLEASRLASGAYGYTVKGAAEVATWVKAKGSIYFGKVVEFGQVTGAKLVNKLGFARAACFSAQTLVLTDNGLKAIVHMKVGDRVWSRPESGEGEAGWRKVLAATCTGEQTIWEVRVTTPTGKTETLRTTYNHPFWSETGGEECTGGFVATSELEVSEKLRLHDGAAGFVLSVVETAVIEPVYNITVDGHHTYHVGELGVWVHNECWGDILTKAGIQKPVGMIDGHGHHIILQRGNGPAQKALVAEGQAILRSVGIDPIKGVENLVWASNNIKGMHPIGPLKAVVTDLRNIAKPTYDDVVRVLREHGKSAQSRSRYWP